jgi:hypothetical protein
VPGDQHRHQVVAQLAVAQVGTARVDEEAQQRGVGDLAGAVVARGEGLGVLLVAGGSGAFFFFKSQV